MARRTKKGSVIEQRLVAMQAAIRAKALIKAAYMPLAKLNDRMLLAALAETAEAIELWSSLERRSRGGTKRLAAWTCEVLARSADMIEADLQDLEEQGPSNAQALS